MLVEIGLWKYSKKVLNLISQFIAVELEKYPCNNVIMINNTWYEQTKGTNLETNPHKIAAYDENTRIL